MPPCHPSLKSVAKPNLQSTDIPSERPTPPQRTRLPPHLFRRRRRPGSAVRIHRRRRFPPLRGVGDHPAWHLGFARRPGGGCRLVRRSAFRTWSGPGSDGVGGRIALAHLRFTRWDAQCHHDCGRRARCRRAHRAAPSSRVRSATSAGSSRRRGPSPGSPSR